MYKELAAELRLFETVCKHSDKPDLADLVGRAANAIEELQKKYDGAVSDNKSLCGQIAELAKERNEAYSKGLLEGGIAQRAEDEKRMPQWIPVTERLPSAEKEVYVTDGEYIARANLLDEVFPGDKPCWSYSGLGEITHWCKQIPLPQPPKEETCEAQ